MAKHVRVWGPGYPEADTPPMTDEERRQMALRKKLLPPDWGRRNPDRKQDPDQFRAVGLPLDEEAGECPK